MIRDKLRYNFKEIIKKTFGNGVFAVCTARNKNAEIKYEISNGNNRNCHYAIKYYPDREIFVVWDINLHKQLGASLILTVNTETIEQVDLPYGIKECYKTIRGADGKSYYEKVLFVHMSRFEEFIDNYEFWMRFNKFDEEFPNDLRNDDYNTDIQRKRYSTSLPKRAADFRYKVLRSYGSQCAICRCRIKEVLQAAHEHGYEVCRTVYDNYRHGICLCANHHLMYDCGLIDIDLKTLTINYNNETLKGMACFKKFDKEYAGKIIKQAILQEDNTK